MPGEMLKLVCLKARNTLEKTETKPLIINGYSKVLLYQLFCIGTLKTHDCKKKKNQLCIRMTVKSTTNQLLIKVFHFLFFIFIITHVVGPR